MKFLILSLAILCSPIFAVCQTSIKCSIIGYGGGEIRIGSSVSMCCVGEAITGDVGASLHAGFINVLRNINGNGVQGHDSPITPREYSLSTPFPNPFNSSTTISYTLPIPGMFAVDIVDISGRSVAKLASGWRQAGSYRAVWNAGSAAAGVYMVKMEAGEFSEVRKVTLIK
jgi:hypothetical protein